MRLSILSFAAGIFILQMQGALPSASILAVLVIAGIVGVFAISRNPSRFSRLFVLLFCAALGFSWAGWRAQERLADHLPEEWEVRDIQLVGVVAQLPQLFERSERFVFDVESVLTPEAIVPRRILLSWYRAWDNNEKGEDEAAVHTIRPGERWRFTVRLRRPHGNANPHGYDYEAWLLERGLRATGSVRAREEMGRLEEFVMRPQYALERLRGILRERFLAELPQAPYVGILAALAIGDQRAIPTAQWETFRRTGITHLVSISGLHVTMVGALMALLVNGVWRRSERLALRLPAQKAAIAVGWLSAMAYALLAGFEVPAQRTAFMLSVLAISLWSGKNLGASKTLLLALLVVLLLDPWAVLATGFWLSFGAVAVLFFVSASRSGEVSHERQWSARLWQWGFSQWAVTIGGLPLLLLFFQQFSLVSPMANAVAIPVVSFVITPLALVYALLPWPPLLHLDHWLLSQLMTLLEALAGWPMWQQAAPAWWASLLAVLGVICLLLPRGFPARWLGICLFAPAIFFPTPRPVLDEVWVDVLDVGQGLAVLVRTAEHSLLYDAGPLYGSDADAGQRVVIPFLRAFNVRQLNKMIISHSDKDHSGGFAAIQDLGIVERVLSSSTELGGEPCVAGQSWDWDGILFTMLSPEISDYSKRSKTSNSLSCVLRIDNGRTSLLLTADIEAADERALIARTPVLLRSDVLLAPHHGSNRSSTPGFVTAVAPREVVFSAGYRNSFRHPRPEVLKRYAHSRHWRTDRDGAIHIVLADSAKVSAWRNDRPRYWHRSP